MCQQAATMSTVSMSSYRLTLALQWVCGSSILCVRVFPLPLLLYLSLSLSVCVCVQDAHAISDFSRTFIKLSFNF